MNRYYIDAGTTWTKILKVQDDKKSYEIIKSKDLASFNFSDARVFATGHSVFGVDCKNWENEIVALSWGAKKYLENDHIVLDLGSRDIKYVRFQNKKFKDMDWNSNCASSTGATIEMLLKFYEIDCDDLTFVDEKYGVTCGIFGLEHIMDEVSKGGDPKIAIAKFIHGVAYRAWVFAKKPDKICISGGFCNNKCFVDSLSKYCEVTTLGRFVLCDGLYEMNN